LLNNGRVLEKFCIFNIVARVTQPRRSYLNVVEEQHVAMLLHQHYVPHVPNVRCGWDGRRSGEGIGTFFKKLFPFFSNVPQEL
jgi:hypothetical protein